MAASQHDDYQAGLADGQARAETFPGTATRTLAVTGSAAYQAGWRAGFAGVRNRRHREEVARRVLEDPRTRQDNTDGGLAAADFIRNAAARNTRPAAEKAASHRENVQRVLAAIRQAQR